MGQRLPGAHDEVARGAEEGAIVRSAKVAPNLLHGFSYDFIGRGYTAPERCLPPGLIVLPWARTPRALNAYDDWSGFPAVAGSVAKSRGTSSNFKMPNSS